MRLRGKKVLVSRKDVYSCDCTLSPIIAAVLRKFREEADRVSLFGTPISIFHDFGIAKHEEYEYSDEQSKTAHEKWKEVIDDMIFAFEFDEHKSNEYWQEYSDSLEMKFHPLEQGTQLEIVCHNSDAEKNYRELDKELRKRKQRGLNYFAKYYDNLWW